LIEDDLDEITKEWSLDLLVSAKPVEMSDVDSLETATNIPGPSKTKKTEEVHDLDNAFFKTASISPEQGGDDEEINGVEVEQKKGKCYTSKLLTLIVSQVSSLQRLQVLHFSHKVASVACCSQVSHVAHKCRRCQRKHVAMMPMLCL
jgi:hypothetical protein